MGPLLYDLSHFTCPRSVIRKAYLFIYFLVFFFLVAVHELLGLKGSNFQSLYHFTVGGPVLDKRIMSLPAYPGPDSDT